MHNSNNTINKNKIITEIYYPHILAITRHTGYHHIDP